VRWITIGLLILNLGYFLVGKLEYAYQKKLTVKVDGEYIANSTKNMPGHQLVLVTQDMRAVIENNNVDNTPTTLTTESNKKDQCELVGPISMADNSQLTRIREMLYSKGISTQIKEVSVSGRSDYWVYLPPEISRERAVLKLRELKGKKIDSFIIPEGLLLNGISLGVFDIHENAEKRQRELSDMGYAPEISENTNKYKEGWLLVRSEQNTESISSELLGQIKSTGLEVNLRKEGCSEVASWIDIN